MSTILSNLTIWTIGHSNHPLPRLAELLHSNGITILADVRSSPYSRYAPQFNREVLAVGLKLEHIDYLYLGDELGGRPAEAKYHDEDGHILYGAYKDSEKFKHGVQGLIESASQTTVAIMCGEESPLECHRRLLVGRYLLEKGVTVRHIRGDGRVQSDDEVEKESFGGKDDNQATLFDTRETLEWKSVRSVLPKKAPNSSSRR